MTWRLGLGLFILLTSISPRSGATMPVAVRPPRAVSLSRAARPAVHVQVASRRGPLWASDHQGALDSLHGAVSDHAFDAAARSLPRSVVHTLIRTGKLAERLTPDQVARFKRVRLEKAVQELEGRLYWGGGSGPGQTGEPSLTNVRIKDPRLPKADDNEETNLNHFVLWLGGYIPEIRADARMNCWEGVLFAAYKAGLVQKSDLAKLYRRSAAAANKSRSPEGTVSVSRYAYPIWRALNGHRGVPYGGRAGKQPELGDIVFFDGVGHVAMALGSRDAQGNHEILSLWHGPTIDGRLQNNFQRTTIEATRRFTASISAGGKEPHVEIAPHPW